MAQSGYTPIQLYYSTTAAAVPTAGNLNNGELAINITDGKLYYKSNAGVVTLLAGATSGPAGGSNTQVQYNSSGVLAGSANMTFDGTTLTAAGFSGPHNGTVGSTTPNTGSFTTLTTSSTVTLNGGTANGVTYLNASKVLTSNSALSFDGTTLTTTSNGSTPALRVYGAGTAQGQISFNSTDTYKIQGGPDYLALNFFTNGTNRYSIDSTGIAIWSVGGSESMRLNSTGLGIGTSSPSFKFQTKVATNGNFAVTTPNSGTGARVWVVNDAVSAVQRLELQGNPVVFPLTSGADGMYFDASTGNLGLGVTPSAWRTAGGEKALQVGPTLTAYSNSGGDVYWNKNWYLNSSSQNIYLTNGYAQSYGMVSGDHRWYIAPSGTAGTTATFTQAMTLDASGNLGVGTTTLFSGVTIADATNINNQARLNLRNNNSDGSNRIGIIGYNSNNITIQTGNESTGTANNTLAQFRYDNIIFYTGTTATNPTERARIDSSGNLGVGTTSPSTRIHAVATGGAIRMQDSTGTAKYVQMRSDSTNSHLEHVGGPGDALRINNQAAGTIEFFTSNTERARIDSSGNLLVGLTTSPGGSGAISARSSTAAHSFDSTSGTEVIAIAKANGYRAYLGTVSSLDSGLQIKDYVGSVTLTVGTSGKSVALQGGTVVTGTGITFPATQVASSDANTLDDYEEGTWTPTYTLGSGSFTTITYAAQSGYYVKVGRMVWCYWDLATASVNYGANGSSQVYISGLPFTPQSTAGAGIINQANNWASNNPNSVICSAGTAVLYPGNNNWIQNAATIASYMNTATATRNETHGCIVYITST